MPTTRLLVLAGVATFLVACSPPGSDTANGGLANTSWTVIAIAGQPTVPDARPTMAFAPEGSVSGSAGCNQYTGRFRTEGDRIAVGQVSSTLMGCDGQRGQQESAFLVGLEGSATWRQTEDGNLVIAGTAEIVAGPGVAEGPPGDALPSDAPTGEPVAGLSGTTWNLAKMGGTADFAGRAPTLEFGPDGAVAGFAGCNSFKGSYTVDGDTLRLGELATTKKGCERPATTLEAAYLAALTGATTWVADDAGRLTLGGTVPLTFRPR